MPKKKQNANEQKSHDECVRELAKELKSDNWTVKANLEGVEKPAMLGGFMPDIEATKKGCRNCICEVLTEKDFKGNKEAYIEFKNYCDEYDFHFYIVDKNGKHRQIDPNSFGKKEG
jgi:hypothetical protein